MTETEPNKEALQEELGQIKHALGLAEEYPYWWRWWLVEGVGVGILFPLIQFGFNRGFSSLLLVVLVGVFLVHQYVSLRVLKGYERPSTGVPSWTTWNAILIAGVVALTTGFNPIFDQVAQESRDTIMFVFLGSIGGVCYLFMGQLLEAYNIRKVDRYAFYIGGVWFLMMVAILPHVTLLQDWELAAFGIGIAIHNIATYLILSKK